MRLKRFLKYLSRFSIFIVISLVTGLCLYTISVKRVTGSKLVMPFNKTIAYVYTGSMEPTISVNDLIVIKRTNDYDINDIVVYQDGSMLVVHRIVKIEDELITTAGDANDGSLDDPIKQEAIYGEVIKIIPFLGFVFKCLKNPINIVLLMSLAIILLVLSYKKEDADSKSDVDLLKEEIEKLKKELNK